MNWFQRTRVAIAVAWNSIPATARPYVIGAGAFLVLVLLALVFWPYEFVVALIGITLYVGWLALVIATFWIDHPVEAAERRFYHWPFGSNERRWVVLLVLAMLYFVMCSWIGRGQPLIHGLEDGLVSSFHEVQSTGAYERGEAVATTLGKKWMERVVGTNEQTNKFIGVEPTPAAKPAKKRPFYGLYTWTHWFVFIFLYLPTLVVYGIAMRREEIGEAIRHWQERRQARRTQQQQAGPAAAPAGGPAGIRPDRARNTLIWADIMLDLYDVLPHLWRVVAGRGR